MKNNALIEQTAKQLLKKDNILIICHKNPDGDTIGSGAGLLHALLDIGKTAAVLCNDEFAPRYEYMNIELFNNQFKPEFIVAVDVASQNLFGENTLPYSNHIDLSIDHHPSNTNYAKSTCCMAECASTTQLVYKIIVEMGIPISKLIANCLYTGLITDTGCFKFSSTTQDTLITGAALMQAGAEHTILVEKFFLSKSVKAVQLEKYALNKLEMFFDDKCAVVILNSEILSKIKPIQTDIEGISNIPRNIEGVDVGITIRQIKEDTYKISIRTSEKANATKIAEGLGGGGHIRAAGCEVIGSEECVKKAILKEVEKALCS